jgi:hypothetical protein
VRGERLAVLDVRRVLDERGGGGRGGREAQLELVERVEHALEPVREVGEHERAVVLNLAGREGHAVDQPHLLRGVSA